MNILTKFKQNIIQLFNKYISSGNDFVALSNTSANDKSDDTILSKENKDKLQYVEEPFIYSYLDYDSVLKKLVDSFEDNYNNEIANEFTPEVFSQLYHSTISHENFLTTDKKEVLNKIWLDCYFIYKTLSPLRDLGIDYSSDLIGGSVRDFLLNKEKEIKDLDICIYLDPHTISQKKGWGYLDETVPEKFMIEIKQHFSEDELNNVDLLHPQHLLDVINKIIVMCMNRTDDISSAKLFTDSERFKHLPDNQYGPEILNMLSALIKTGHKKTSYPIDLIVTDQIKFSFIESVDFNLCRVGFSLTHSEDAFGKNLHFPTSPDALIHRVYSKGDFWKDVYQKTITFDLNNKKLDQILFSFGERLTRLKSKYPDYPVNINYPYSLLYKEAQTALLNNELQNQLPIEKNEPSTLKRNKI